MSQCSNPHSHWWREIKASGKITLGACIVHMGYTDPVAKHYTLWQVAAIRLHVAQQEASRWWDGPSMLHGALSTGLFPPASDPPKLPDNQTGEDTGFGQGNAGLGRGVRSQDRHPMQIPQGTPPVHGPIDDPKWGWCHGNLPVEEELGPSTTPEGETTLLGEGDGSSECQGLLPDNWRSPGL